MSGYDDASQALGHPYVIQARAEDAEEIRALRARVAELEAEVLSACRVEIGTRLLVEAENGAQLAGGRYTLLVSVERFDTHGAWVRRHFDGIHERLTAPFRVLPPLTDNAREDGGSDGE